LGGAPLVACCGLLVEEIPDLHLGSVATARLREVLEAAPDDFLKIWLHVEGPERILEWVKVKLPAYRCPTGSVHPCETCRHLYHDAEVRAIIRDGYEEKVDEILPLFMAGVASTAMNQQQEALALSGAE
jgi:hypothetical protein